MEAVKKKKLRFVKKGAKINGIWLFKHVPWSLSLYLLCQTIFLKKSGKKKKNQELLMHWEAIIDNLE